MGESIYGQKRSHMCTELGAENIGQKVTVMGWVHKRRDLGRLIFIDLRDRTGLLQVVFNNVRNIYKLQAKPDIGLV